MKQKICLFLLGVILFVCQTKASTINDVSAIETEMINFFRSTLQRNYGSSDGKAVKLMMDALLHYKFHYIIDVDKEALKAINDKLYPDMFGSYFVETLKSIRLIHFIRIGNGTILIILFVAMNSRNK